MNHSTMDKSDEQLLGHNNGSGQQANDSIAADLMMDEVNQDETGDFDFEHDDEHEGDEHGDGKDVLREQDRFLPIANIARIMKRVIPDNGKVAKDAKETCQECVSEFISFITSEASERCQHEKRKTINGEDLLWAMQTLGFDNYVEPLKLFLAKFREANKGGDNKNVSGAPVDPSAYLIESIATDSTTPSSSAGVSGMSVPVSAIIQQLSAGPQSIFIQAGANGTQQLMMTTAGGIQIPIQLAAPTSTSMRMSQPQITMAQQQMSHNSQQQQQQPQIIYFDSNGSLQLASGNATGLTMAPASNQNSSKPDEANK